MRPAIAHSYFPAFDTFRGIGILFVVLAHSPIQIAVVDALRPIGALGVHMFFALSGFLITHRLVEEYEQTGAVRLKDFYLRRARRILPPALIYLAVLAALGPLLQLLPTTPQEISASVFFSRNLYQPPATTGWYTAHFWSLSLEEQFYLVWPLILVMFGPTRGRTRLVTLGLILVTVVWRIYALGRDPAANIYRSDLLADHLLWGCLLGLTWKHIRLRLSPVLLGLIGAAGIMAATLLIYLQPLYWQAFFAMSVAVGFVFAADASRNWAGRLKLLRKLGQASYDVYIWQSLFLPLPFVGAKLLWPQQVPWSYLLIAAISAMSFWLTFPRTRRRPETL